MDVSDVLEWKVDGHTVTFHLDQSEIRMFPGACPAVINGPCRFAPNGDCIVAYYVGLYGIDLNVGFTVIDQEWVEVAWTFQGDKYRLEESQIWIIPRNDPSFSAWYATFQADEDV